MQEIPLWDAFLTGGLSSLPLLLLGWACSKSFDKIGVHECFMRCLVDHAEMVWKRS